MKIRWFWNTECERHITSETLFKEYEEFLLEYDDFKDKYPTFDDYINECTSKNGTLEEESIPKKRRFAKGNGYFPCNDRWDVRFDDNNIGWEVLVIDRCENISKVFYSDNYDDCLDYIEVRCICEEEDRIG